MDTNWFEQSWLMLQEKVDPLVLQVFIVVFLTLVANYAARMLFHHLEKQFIKTKNLWDDSILEAIRKPAGSFIWVVGIAWAAQLLDAETEETQIFGAVEPLRDVLLIAIVAWFAVRLIKAAELRLQSPEYVHKPMDQTTASAMGKLLRATVVITASLIALQTAGYSVSSVVAFGGIGGIAIGFAAKDLLANFFGGMMIYLDRPFKVGDWIRSPDREIEGTVEDIGWRLTMIRTFDKRPLYVPNSMFTTMTVENPSRMLNRRIYETIGLRYDDAAVVGPIVNDVKSMLESHPEIDANQTLIVNFNAYGPSSLDFFVYTFTKTTDWVYFHEVKQDVLLKILEIVAQHGADVAYPTSTVKISEPVHIEDSRPQA